MLHKFSVYNRGGNIRGAEEAMYPTPTPVLLFFCNKTKKMKQMKKERVSKQKLLKCCHQGQNVTVLAILERLEFKFLLADQPWRLAILSMLHDPPP